MEMNEQKYALKYGKQNSEIWIQNANMVPGPLLTGSYLITKLFPSSFVFEGRDLLFLVTWFFVRRNFNR